MSLVKFLKKFLILSVLTVVFSALLNMTAFAYSWGEFGEDVGDLFSTGEQGFSFTQYEGQLTQLSPEGLDPALTGSDDAREFIIKVVNYALGFLGLIAVLIIIYSGVLYVTAAGQDEQVGKAKKAIAYAAIGLLIILGSFAFVNTIVESGTSGEEGGSGGSATTISAKGGSFNASAEQVRALALEIYNGFKFLGESTEELKNIQNDAAKDSLNPSNLPSKNEVLSFLYSVQSKLTNMRARMQRFGSAESKINDHLRDLEKQIDTVNAFGGKVYLKITDAKNYKIEVCDVEAEREEWHGFSSPSDQELCNDAGYPHAYTEGLFETWIKIRQNYLSLPNESDVKNKLNEIVKPLAADYKSLLEEKLADLAEIYNEFANLSAVENGQAQKAYFELMSSSGYGYNAHAAADNPNAKQNNGLYGEVEDWSMNSSIEEAGNYLLFGLKQQSILFEELNDLQFVQARLTANVVNGPSPLVVVFDTIGTVDPAGGSIQGENITWDLGGTLSTAQFLKSDMKGKTILPDDVDSVTCDFKIPDAEKSAGKTTEDFIGENAKRCVFHKPGTYTAAIKIDSNEPTKFAPGISVLTIKVQPPTTKIELKVGPPGEPQTVMDWDDSTGLLLTDKRTVKVTSNDVKAGIIFDASATKDASQFKWDLGNGEIIDFSTKAKLTAEDYEGYEEPGRYEVTLEVINILGDKDKKIFTLEVSSLLARINPIPQSNVRINTPVTFDGSGSKSDIGKITSYEWTIDYDKTQQIPSSILQELNKIYPVKDSGSNLRTIKHEFKYPLKYDITLKVKDKDITDEVILEDFRVESQPPIAGFNYNIPDKTQPSTVHFNGSNSFDPDGTTDFKYKWSISPGKEGDDWEYLDISDNNFESKKPKIKFNEKGEYDVTLRVTDPLANNEFSEITKTVKIDNILDVAWDPDQQITAVLDEEGNAKFEFEIVSENGNAFEIDFGNGEVDGGELGDTIEHTYKSAGRYVVRVTVYDDENNQNSIEKRVFVSGGGDPLANITLLVNNEEILDTSDTVIVSKKDILTFDASNSKNFDGTDQRLKYSWNFGDNKNSSKRSVTHTYKEISPKEPGYYEVTLLVVDQDDPDKSAEETIQIQVVNQPPHFTSVQAVPVSAKLFNSLQTPVQVNMRVYGEEDPDGQIIKYRWWYFDVNDPDEPLGMQITTGPTTQLTIGTKGKEGAQMSYGFGLEITDNDGLVYSNEDAIESGDYSKVTVVNGPNKLPTAKMTVSQTSVFVDDTISFSSASTDPDGQIVAYIWDLEGDGFHNNEPTKDSSIEYKYTKMNKDGYPVRLKVIDDKGGEGVSAPLKIYVDSLAKPPVADYEFEPVKGSGGMKIRFVNKSSADEIGQAKIIRYQWDFDTDSNLDTADSDLDGDKANDVNSTDRDPQRLYTKPGTYRVRLTVIDDHNNQDEIIKTVKVPILNQDEPIKPTDKPEDKPVNKELSAALITTPVPSNDGVVYLSGNTGTVKFDFSKSTGSIAYYIIDKNIYFDTDGNGNKTDDEDFKTQLPGTWTTNFDKSWGKTVVKLTVKDIYSNEHSTTQEIGFN